MNSRGCYISAIWRSSFCIQCRLPCRVRHTRWSRPRSGVCSIHYWRTNSDEDRWVFILIHAHRVTVCSALYALPRAIEIKNVSVALTPVAELRVWPPNIIGQQTGEGEICCSVFFLFFFSAEGRENMLHHFCCCLHLSLYVHYPFLSSSCPLSKISPSHSLSYFFLLSLVWKWKRIYPPPPLKNIRAESSWQRLHNEMTITSDSDCTPLRHTS